MTDRKVAPEIVELEEHVMRHDDPPAPRDPQAYAALSKLAHDAAGELARLGAPLVAIASGPNRFNDVSNFDWLLARVGDDIVEHDAYVTTRAEYGRRIAAANASVRAAAAVLERLETADWRGLFIRAFDLPLGDEFVAVVVQHGLLWFVYASSNLSGREHVFALSGDGGMSYFGECVERTDEELLDGRGLVFGRAT